MSYYLKEKGVLVRGLIELVTSKVFFWGVDKIEILRRNHFSGSEIIRNINADVFNEAHSVLISSS